MIQVRLNKILSVVLSGLLFWTYINHDYSKWGSRGREAFLAYQSGRFDRYMAPNHPVSISIFGILAFTILAALIYEGIAALLSKILPARKPS